MKSLIPTSLIFLACLLSACTTHVHPKTTRTVYQSTPSTSYSPAARISADTPDNTTVVRPAE